MFQVNDPFKRTIMRQSSWSSGCFYSHCDSRSSVWTCPHADLSKQKRSDFTLKSLLLRKKNKAHSIALTCPLEAIKCHHDQWKVHETCAYQEVIMLHIVDFAYFINTFVFACANSAPSLWCMTASSCFLVVCFSLVSHVIKYVTVNAQS